MGFKEYLKEQENNPKGFVTDIEKETVENNNFRKVLYTAKNIQLVLMSLKQDEDIGEEVHEDVDQFFRIEQGKARVIIGDSEHELEDDFSFIIPAGVNHNVINIGNNDLKLYTIYTPPHHKDGSTFSTKEESEENEEHFDGETTEKL
ncbi:MAG: cupin domain-containing protein [bacterium]